LKLQIAGLTAGHDQTVVRGDSQSTACSVFCFREGRFLGVESVNRPGEHMAGRRLLASQVALTPGQAADASVDFKQLIASASPTPR